MKRCARMDSFGPWRSLASALAWGARGPEFKSRRPDQIPPTLSIECFGPVSLAASSSLTQPSTLTDNSERLGIPARSQII